MTTNPPSPEKPAPEKPLMKCDPDLAQKINDALDEECPHGAETRWNCYPCTADAIAPLLSAAELAAVKACARLVCAPCANGIVPDEKGGHLVKYPDHTYQTWAEKRVRCAAQPIYARYPAAAEERG